jgi:hypothetical protein
MDTKTLKAVAKKAADSAAAWASYNTVRAVKRAAFDAETERRSAELKTEMYRANRAYREAYDAIGGSDGAAVEDV